MESKKDRQRKIAAALEQLSDPHPKKRRSAVWSLKAYKNKDAVDGLLIALADDDRTVRSAAATYLRNLKNSKRLPDLKGKIEDQLIEALSHPNEERRNHAAELLRSFGGTKAVPPLLEALKDKNEDVRAEVAQTFRIIKDPRAVPSLIQALSDEAPEVRKHAAMALGDIDDPTAVPALVEQLSEPDVEIRKAMLWGLEHIGDPAAVPALIEVLNTGDHRSAQSAIYALKKIEDKRVTPALIGALRKGLVAAVSPVAKVKDEEAVVELFKALINSMDTDMRREIELWLSIIGEAGIPVLLETLEHEEWLARSMAVRILAKIDLDKFTPTLINAMQDEDWMVRWTAIEPLAKSKHPDSLAALTEALSDPVERIREEASLALGATEVHEKLQMLALKLHAALEHSGAYRIPTSSDEFLAALNPHKSHHLHDTAKRIIKGTDDPWNILLTFPVSLIGFLKDRLYAGSWDIMDGATPLFKLFESLCTQVEYQFEWQFDEEARQLHFRFDEYKWSVECQSLKHIDEPLSFSKIEPNMYEYLEEKGWTLFPVALDSVQEFYLIPNEGVSHIRDLIIPCYRPMHPLYDERVMWYFEGLPEDKRPDDPWDLLKGPIPE